MKRLAFGLGAAVLIAATVGVRVYERAAGPGDPLMRLAPGDVDRIELIGTCLNKRADPFDPDSAGEPQIIRDQAQIATILGTLQRSRPQWHLHRSSLAELDEIRIYTKEEPAYPTCGIGIFGLTVGSEYGPEVKRMYEEYCQRTYEQMFGPFAHQR